MLIWWFWTFRVVFVNMLCVIPKLALLLNFTAVMVRDFRLQIEWLSMMWKLMLMVTNSQRIFPDSVFPSSSLFQFNFLFNTFFCLFVFCHVRGKGMMTLTLIIYRDIYKKDFEEHAGEQWAAPEIYRTYLHCIGTSCNDLAFQFCVP